MSHVFKEETLEELSKVEDLTDFGEIEKNEHLLEDVEDEDAAAPDLFDPSSSLNSLNQFQDNDLIPDHEYLSFDNYEHFVLGLFMFIFFFFDLFQFFVYVHIF